MLRVAHIRPQILEQVQAQRKIEVFTKEHLSLRGKSQILYQLAELEARRVSPKENDQTTNSPLILCNFEGHTHSDIASIYAHSQMGASKGLINSHLSTTSKDK